MVKQERVTTYARPDNKSILLLPRDIKEILHCNSSTLYKLLNDKHFPSFKVNSRYYVIYEDFLLWAKNQVREFHR